MRREVPEQVCEQAMRELTRAKKVLLAARTLTVDRDSFIFGGLRTVAED